MSNNSCEITTTTKNWLLLSKHLTSVLISKRAKLRYLCVCVWKSRLLLVLHIIIIIQYMDFGFLYIEETVVIRFRYTANASMRAALPATAVCVCVCWCPQRETQKSRKTIESQPAKVNDSHWPSCEKRATVTRIPLKEAAVLRIRSRSLIPLKCSLCLTY